MQYEHRDMHLVRCCRHSKDSIHNFVPNISLVDNTLDPALVIFNLRRYFIILFINKKVEEEEQEMNAKIKRVKTLITLNSNKAMFREGFYKSR